jgi:hypothetical protein
MLPKLPEQENYPLKQVWGKFIAQINRELVAFDIAYDEAISHSNENLTKLYIDLVAFFEDFISKDERGLEIFLYKVDIKEDLYCQASVSGGMSYPQILADLFLNRCYQKAVTKLMYQK